MGCSDQIQDMISFGYITPKSAATCIGLRDHGRLYIPTNSWSTTCHLHFSFSIAFAVQVELKPTIYCVYKSEPHIPAYHGPRSSKIILLTCVKNMIFNKAVLVGTKDSMSWQSSKRQGPSHNMQFSRKNKIIVMTVSDSIFHHAHVLGLWMLYSQFLAWTVEPGSKGSAIDFVKIMLICWSALEEIVAPLRIHLPRSSDKTTFCL